MNLLSGKWVVQAIATAAELGLAEALGSPASAEALAERVSCEPERLLRLLRVLCGEGLLEELPSGEYRLTPLGEQLRGSEQRRLAQFVGSASQWLPWTELTASLRGGECAFVRAHGASLFDYLQAHPGEARLYDEAVDTFTRQQAVALAASAALPDGAHVVDVGGGRGTFLIELLKRRPSLRGTLVDRPHVVAAAAARFVEAGLEQRLATAGGDFFEALPPGGSHYVLKHVLHNWSDARCTELLAQCRNQLPVGGRVLVVEGLRLPGNQRDLTKLMDLEMLVLTGGGRERSKPEFRALLAAARLRLEQTLPLALGAWLLVASPRH